MAFGDVVSSDVVGYDTFGLRGNGQAAGAGISFLNVDASATTISDLSITGYSGSYAEAEVQAKMLDGFGRGGTTYYWYDFTEEGQTYLGWFGESGEDYNDIEVAPGEGLWIYSPSTSFKLQSSGVVPKTPIAVALRGNGQAKMVANPMPATLKLGSISITGYSGAYAEAEVQAKKLDGFGRGGTTYYWYDFTEEGVTYYGWYGENGEDYNDVDVAPGEGLWVYSPSTSFSVVFPSPL